MEPTHRNPLETHLGEETTAEARVQSRPREFATAEELLRVDAAQTPAPASLAERVAASVRNEPLAGLPWWRRWFRGGS